MMNREYTANCAICGAPGEPECPCEGNRLTVAIEQAEKKWIESWVAKTREWVTNNAINTITTMYNKKKEHRKVRYSMYLRSLPYWPIFEQYHGHPPLHPHLVAQLQRQIADADVDLRRGIDADWKSCVVRYPEVLEHFYSQVNVTFPKQVEPAFGSPLQPRQQQPLPPPPRAPSVNPQAQAAAALREREAHAQSILRSSTVQPKKQRRQSKVGLPEAAPLDEPDLFAAIAALQGLNKGGHKARSGGSAMGGMSGAGMGRSNIPPPPSHTAGGAASRAAQRPGGKKGASKEYVVSGGRGPGAPPHAPPPPSFHGGISSFDGLY